MLRVDVHQAFAIDKFSRIFFWWRQLSKIGKKWGGGVDVIFQSKGIYT